MIDSRSKGKAFERKIAHLLNQRFGTRVRRTPSSGSIEGWKGDLIELSGPLSAYHFECKHQERLNVWAALAQATRQAALGKIPILIFTKNVAPLYVAMEWEYWCQLIEDTYPRREPCEPNSKHSA